MMNKDEIQEFFLLKNNLPLFEVAIRPPSCGGGAEFEQLALYGDLAINWHLYDYLIGKDRKRKGDITTCKGTIHHWTVIKAFAEEFLGIPAILNPTDINHKPQDDELAETVEALIGATIQTNDIESCKPIVHSFIEFALESQEKLREEGEFDPSQNYFGQLGRLFKDPRYSKHVVELKKSDIEPTQIECANGSYVFQYEGSITFNGVNYKRCTQYWKKKAEARNEAAFLFLCDIAGKDPKYTKYNPAINQSSSQEKTVYPTTSIESEELIFRKPDSMQHESMEVSHDTGELLTDYINRKAKKDAFSMLKLLSTRLDTVSGASWTCDISPDVLAIINLQLGNEKYFSIGMGPSKTKARKAAGEKLLKEINIIEWVEKHYPSETI